MTGRHLADFGIVVLTMIIMAFLVYPTFWVFLSSFKTPETMFSATRWQLTLDNYVHLFKAGFGANIVNSLIVCLTSVIISTVLSVNAAYAVTTHPSAAV